MRHSIRIKVTSIFVGLMALTLVACWCINNFFLEDFYIMKKKDALLNVENQLQYLVTQSHGDLSSSDLNLQVLRLGERYNVNIYCTDPGWSNQMSIATNQEVIIKKLRSYVITGGMQNISVIYDGGNYKITKYFDNSMKSDYMDCWGYLDQGYAFILSTPLESIKESVIIANQFLIYIGILCMVLSAIAIFIATRQITKPILVLSEISRRISNLDFEARYTGKEQNEIGILGNNVNNLALRLEATISELKSANTQLKKDIEEKIQIDEMRKEFLSNVSHELKTPIALIQGYAEGLKESVNDDEESRDFYCEVIMDEADKMNKMVRKLLTLNQIEFGREEVLMEKFDLVELIQSVVNNAAIMIAQKEAKVDLLINGPLYVLGDEFKVEEVVTNYLSNALNHLNFEKRIRIRARVEGNQVYVAVHNTGMPIPDADLDKVWIKFYKVDKARTREYGGSGIGLSIVKAIMDSFHQPCGVRNIDNGVEFWFRLQLADEVE